MKLLSPVFPGSSSARALITCNKCQRVEQYDKACSEGWVCGVSPFVYVCNGCNREVE